MFIVYISTFASKNVLQFFPPLLDNKTVLITNTPLFLNLLITAIKAIIELPPSFSTIALDELVEILTEALQVAYTVSARRTVIRGKGNSWWNSEFKITRREHKSKIKIDVSIKNKGTQEKNIVKSLRR